MSAPTHGYALLPFDFFGKFGLSPDVRRTWWRIHSCAGFIAASALGLLMMRNAAIERF
jgi:hypothetical protein